MISNNNSNDLRIDNQLEVNFIEWIWMFKKVFYVIKMSGIKRGVDSKTLIIILSLNP